MLGASSYTDYVTSPISAKGQIVYGVGVAFTFLLEPSAACLRR